MEDLAGVTKIEYCPLSPSQQKLVVIYAVIATVAIDLAALAISAAIAMVGIAIGGNGGIKILFFAAVFLITCLLSVDYKIKSTRKAFSKTAQPLILTSGGVIFPFGALIQLRGRRWRRWEELSLVSLRWREGGEFECDDAVVLAFKDGCQATLTLQSTSNQDIEKFLIALEMWAPQAALSANFAELRGFISPALTAQGVTSYTALWNDELSRRFSLATFKILPPGTKLQDGRYEITSQLGFGGFTAVYNGVNARGQQVVIKEMSLAQIDNDETKKALMSHLEREAELLARLSHKRICRLLDTFVERERQYLVLEKISGKTLRQMVAESGAMSEKAVLSLSVQMIEVLSYLHEQSPPLVHRDFTPDNLIVREGNYLVLIDFNAATEFISGATGTIIGRHHYMPAEQIKGKSQPASDYYSMAGTLAFLLTGKDPRPLTQLNLRADGVKISEQLDCLLCSMTEMDYTARPDLAHITSVLQTCASMRG